MKNEEYYRRNPVSLEFERINLKSNKIWPILILAFFILGFSSVVKINTVFEKIPVIVNYNQEKCDSQNIKNYIKKINLRYPDIVYKQILLESSYLKNPLVKTHNNLLCMENATWRPTVGINVGTRFTRYNTWQDCIVDYALWQATFATNINSEAEYYALLDRLYCPSVLEENKGDLYSTRLKRIK